MPTSLIGSDCPYFKGRIAYRPPIDDLLDLINMDYEMLKEQWSDVEDRDGIRLSWNVIPSTRMVCVHAMKPGVLHSQTSRKHRGLSYLSVLSILR